ncbi:metallophosphoesterase [Methanococcoides sp. LMO-2]|uniref:Phosphoesterase n=1 Tax=Methanococcoides cohabitans TaxID=3136559 RepID=A0ABU9KQM3_9EURY
MKIIILSDTHIKAGMSLIEKLPDDLVTIMRNSDILIHAGDFETMECYNELASLGNLVAVRGDTDVPEIMELLPERKVIEVEGLKVGVIHRGQLTSDNPDGLRYLAKEMGVDVLIFGHFHHPIIEDYEVLLLSPGSPTVPGVAEPSAIELEIVEGKVTGRVIRCDEDVCRYFEYEKK